METETRIPNNELLDDQQIAALVDTDPAKSSMFDPDGSRRRNSIIIHLKSIAQQCHLPYVDLDLLDVAKATIDLKLAVHRAEMIHDIVIPRDHLIPPPTKVGRVGAAG